LEECIVIPSPMMLLQVPSLRSKLANSLFRINPNGPTWKKEIFDAAVSVEDESKTN
jgi:hypothetical protein